MSSEADGNRWDPYCPCKVTRKNMVIIGSGIVCLALVAIVLCFLLDPTSVETKPVYYSRFLVIGGDGHKKTEVIDLSDSSLRCKSTFGKLKSERRNAMGGLINETPILCGGEDSNGDRYDSCLVFGQKKTTSIKMKGPYMHSTGKRTNGASVVLNDTTLWLLGGLNYRGRLSTTEFIKLDAASDSATSVIGPALPHILSDSCAVKYNNTHIYLIGGYTSDYEDRVLIYNSILDKWTKGPRLNTGRTDHGCAVIHHEGESWIIVVGGYSNGNGLTSVEVLDPNNGFPKWVQGPDLPYDLRYINQAIVTSPDGGGIIIVGGHNWQSDSNENQKRILESRFTGSEFLPWQFMDQKLNQGRENHVVIPIPKSVTTKCN